MKLAIFILGLWSVGTARGDCAQDLAQDADFANCISGFISIMMNMRTVSSESEDMIKTFCSAEFLRGSACMVQYTEKCPSVLANIPGSEHAVGVLRSLDNMCSEIADADVCKDIMQCVDQEQDQHAEDLPDLTHVDDTIQSISFFCGPMNAQLQCVWRKQDECPHMLNMVEAGVRAVLASKGSQWVGMSHGIVKYVREECPKIPKSFSSDACVKASMGSTEFRDCGIGVARRHDMTNKEDCDAYAAMAKCIDSGLHACGDAVVNAVVTAYRYLKGVPSTCWSRDTAATPSGRHSSTPRAGHAPTDDHSHPARTTYSPTDRTSSALRGRKATTDTNNETRDKHAPYDGDKRSRDTSASPDVDSTTRGSDVAKHSGDSAGHQIKVFVWMLITSTVFSLCVF